MSSEIVLPRLNPRLTQRRPAPPSEPPPVDEDDDDDESDDGENNNGSNNKNFDDDDDEEEGLSKPSGKMRRRRNRNANLIHPGRWIPKEHDGVTGLLIDNTGVWNCCGNMENLSIYCTVLTDSVQFVSSIYPQIRTKRNKENKLDGKAAREAYEKKITLQQQEKELLQEHGKGKDKIRSEWTQQGLVERISSKEPTLEEKAMMAACSSDSILNAPMLIMWLNKNIPHEPVIMRGMALVLNHLQSGDGCQMLQRQGAYELIITVHRYYTNHPPVQQLCISTLRKLLDCNLTRDVILNNHALETLRTAFTIAHAHMNSRSHMEEATRCIAQCSRNELCRREILSMKIVPYLIEFCKKHSRVPVIVRYTLKTFGWLTTSQDRIDYLFNTKAVVAALECIKRHTQNADILAPGIVFLCRSASSCPPAMAYLLKQRAIPIIIAGLQALYSYERIQLEGLKLLREMSKTKEGFKQISETRGGWQKITQETSYGNALVHDLPGELYNSGWAIGETPHLSELDKKKIVASMARLEKTRGANESNWTPTTIKIFMGMSTAHQTLAINNEDHEAFFELISTLNLLPRPGEERVDWFNRIKEYEEESGISLDEMVATVVEMKKKQAIMDGLALNPDAVKEEVLETAKPVYVGGKHITTKYLSENDKSVQETMAAVL